MVKPPPSSDHYGLLLFDGVPVESQRKDGPEIKVCFHDGNTIFVSPEVWMAKKEYVFISRSFGTREHILKNWKKFQDKIVRF